jgi:hypothetical protein
MHTVKETDMLAAKIDLLLKKFDEHVTEVPQGIIKTMDSQMTCEVCGNVGMTTPRLMKKHHTSTTGITNQEVIIAGTTNLVHHSNVIRI